MKNPGRGLIFVFIFHRSTPIDLDDRVNFAREKEDERQRGPRFFSLVLWKVVNLTKSRTIDGNSTSFVFCSFARSTRAKVKIGQRVQKLNSCSILHDLEIKPTDCLVNLRTILSR